MRHGSRAHVMRITEGRSHRSASHGRVLRAIACIAMRSQCCPHESARRHDSRPGYVRADMSAPLVAIHPDETFDEAVQVMKENHVHHLPVIDDEGRLLGIVAQSDLGRRMSNRELGQLARETSIRGVDRGESRLVRLD